MKLPESTQAPKRYDQAVVVFQDKLCILTPLGNPQDDYRDVLTGDCYTDDFEYTWLIRPGDSCIVSGGVFDVTAIFRGYTGDVLNPFRCERLCGGLYTTNDIRPVDIL